MQILHRLNRQFGALNTQFLANKIRNAVRFESQNINWDFEDVNYQGNAFAKGLASLGYTKNDSILVRLTSLQQAEAYVIKYGAACIGANVIVSSAKTPKQAEKQLETHKVKAIVFEPALVLKDQPYIDWLNTVMPELRNTTQGTALKIAKFPKIQNLIQTNFYSFNGVQKFKSVMSYVDEKYFKLQSVEDFQPLTLPSGKNVILITNAAHDFAFRAGILNSLLNGRYVVVTEPKQVEKICQVHGNNVDFICTEEVSSLPESVRVIVEKGSSLRKQHKNRLEI